MSYYAYESTDSKNLAVIKKAVAWHLSLMHVDYAGKRLYTSIPSLPQ